MKIVIGETLSTMDRLVAAAKARNSVHFVVGQDGQVVDVCRVRGDIHISCLRSRKGTRIFTTWEVDYTLPSPEQCEAVWALVGRLLDQYPEIPRSFSGAFENGFRWGAVFPVEGISAREHTTIRTGGLFMEHYCLCRALGCTPAQSMVFTEQAARKGGKTPIPEAPRADCPRDAPVGVQSGEGPENHASRPPRVGDGQHGKHRQGARG